MSAPPPRTSSPASDSSPTATSSPSAASQDTALAFQVSQAREVVDKARAKAASLPADPEGLEVKPAPAPADKASPTVEVAPSTVTFSVSGVSAALPADETVLEAAEGAGVEIPYACRAGTCGACVVKLLQGEVTMEVESGLAPADKAQGYVLACQAKGTGTPLVVEA